MCMLLTMALMKGCIGDGCIGQVLKWARIQRWRAARVRLHIRASTSTSSHPILQGRGMAVRWSGVQAAGA